MGRIQGDLVVRSFRFAGLIVRLLDDFPNNTKGWVIGKQLIRSRTSIGASIREADHALNDADFAYKCSIARKEASEAHYWLELCAHTELLENEALGPIIEEADELVSILSAIVRKTQNRIRDIK